MSRMNDLLPEQIFLIEDLAENHIGRLDIITVFRARFPSARASREAIELCRSEYLRRRMGAKRLDNYTDLRLTACQMFERGQNVLAVALALNLSRTLTEKYYDAWEETKKEKPVKKKPDAPKKAGRIVFSGGAVFGPETSRTTIWREG